MWVSIAELTDVEVQYVANVIGTLELDNQGKNVLIYIKSQLKKSITVQYQNFFIDPFKLFYRLEYNINGKSG